MDMQSAKMELVRLILNIENPKLISRLNEFLKRETQDFWDELSEIDKKEIKSANTLRAALNRKLKKGFLKL
jgi:hypothetical protein